MRKRFLVVALLVAGVSSLQRDAVAAQVNTAAVIFQPELGGTVLYSGGYAVNWSSSTAGMNASIPRSPGTGALTVYVDGLGVTGTYSCTVYSMGFAAKTFTVSSFVSWQKAVNFAAGDAPPSAYFSITCSVPADGGFKGVTITG
jgi:hypothetical protein